MLNLGRRMLGLFQARREGWQHARGLSFANGQSPNH